ncbi:MAG: ATP-binding protein [Candidatus Magasanikbacteria bacterium]|nr:ATP-binding protein [Candidatus Magasanikbacteria bacterium]
MSIIRDITDNVRNRLTELEVFLFIGSRQSGKTTILKQLQSYLDGQEEKTYFVNLEDPDYFKLLNESPKNLFKIFTFDLKRKSYVFVDEVQYLYDPSHFLKYFFDEYKDSIKLIVSGSSAFYLDKKFKDSLAGRKKIFHIHTLSFREFLRFKDEPTLAKKEFTHTSLSDFERIRNLYREYIIYGGYPRVALASLAEKEDILQEIAYSYIKKDVFDAHIRQDEIFYRLFKLLASGIGGLVNISELSNILNVSVSAIENYLYSMQQSFHISLVRPFFKNMRKELTKMPKVYFYDIGLRNFFVNNFNAFEMREDKGGLLENAVFRQLIENNEEDHIKFWRTVSKNEVDFIVNERRALEVKVNPEQFQPSKYKIFFEHYPLIPLEIASFDTDMRSIHDRAVTNVWEI